MTVAPARTLDLRGTACPLNYVITRLELDRLDAGERLIVWLDHGEPEDQVPRSLRMDGHRVELLRSGDDHARIRVIRNSWVRRPDRARGGKADAEGRPADVAADLGGATVGLDNRPDDGQAQP